MLILSAVWVTRPILAYTPLLGNLQDTLRLKESSGTKQSKSTSEKTAKSSFSGFAASFETAKQAKQCLKVISSQESHKEKTFS